MVGWVRDCVGFVIPVFVFVVRDGRPSFVFGIVHLVAKQVYP